MNTKREKPDYCSLTDICTKALFRHAKAGNRTECMDQKAVQCEKIMRKVRADLYEEKRVYEIQIGGVRQRIQGRCEAERQVNEAKGLGYSFDHTDEEVLHGFPYTVYVLRRLIRRERV